MATERVVVIGGGVAGLAVALAFARAGHPVTVLEQDRLPVSGSAEEAFLVERRGAPQSHQTHGFLARIVVLMRERFPDLLAGLDAAGSSMLTGRSQPRPGDEDLAVLIVRRTTFEWVLRRAVLAEPGVDLRPGGAVAGLEVAGATGAGGVPVVTAARTGRHGPVPGDIVVDCTGRRGRGPAWLAAHGVTVPERVHESGLVYLTRWYRLADDDPGPLDPRLGGDLGFVKYLAVPGDGRTLSVTVAVSAGDRELRGALGDPDRFDRACAVLPGPDRFFGGGSVLRPLGGIRPMGGLVNRVRWYADRAGEPAVLGFHAVGDAHTCTNPLYGRGCALAMVQAVLLADAAVAHPGDPLGRARAFEAASRAEVLPWWRNAVMMDRMGVERGAGPTRPGPPAGAGPDPGDAVPALPGRALAALFAAVGSDPTLGRAFARFWHLLATPAELLTDGELVGRIAAVMADPDAYPAPERAGPSRRQLLDIVAA